MPRVWKLDSQKYIEFTEEVLTFDKYDANTQTGPYQEQSTQTGKKGGHVWWSWYNVLLDQLGHAKLEFLLCLNSSFTNLLTYSQKHTNRKQKHMFYDKNNALFIYLMEKTL